MAPSRRRMIVRVYAFLCVAVVIGAGTAYGMNKLEGRVRAGHSGPVPTSARVVLTDVPEWMPTSLAGQIATGLVPKFVKANDPDLAGAVFRLAQAEPWVRKVHQAKRAGLSPDGKVQIVEVQADFRQPVARAAVGDGSFVYVDVEGVVLPFASAPRYFIEIPAGPDKPARKVSYVSQSEAPRGKGLMAIHYVTIEGVKAPVPPPGNRWAGDDLADGIRLVRLMSSRQYYPQITTVDVRNHNGRSNAGESHICMIAQKPNSPQTIIRWGRFSNPRGDFEISEPRKMAYLDAFAADHKGWLVGVASYIELRGDNFSYEPIEGP